VDHTIVFNNGQPPYPLGAKSAQIMPPGHIPDSSPMHTSPIIRVVWLIKALPEIFGYFPPKDLIMVSSLLLYLSLFIPLTPVIESFVFLKKTA
jgi:hypothetical protein